MAYRVMVVVWNGKGVQVIHHERLTPQSQGSIGTSNDLITRQRGEVREQCGVHKLGEQRVFNKSNIKVLQGIHWMVGAD